MSIEKLEGLLAAIETLNHGPDHGCEYALYSLPSAPSLDEALAAYFSSLSTSRVPSQPAEHWHIKKSALGESWKGPLSEALKRWFFSEDFSPKVDDWNQSSFIEQTISLLLQELGEPEIYEVYVSPPIWYECLWQDFAFSSPKGNWLLHLGFSD